MSDAQQLSSEIARLNVVERRAIARFIRRQRLARDLSHLPRSFGDRVADRVASFGGSWTFIVAALATIVAWLMLNGRMTRPFDPYPFILLNLVLSCTAALQAPVIMMSQNRQTARDRADAQHDYEINTKAELEIVSLHEKLDEIREQKWLELMQLQERQLELLGELRAR